MPYEATTSRQMDNRLAVGCMLAHTCLTACQLHLWTHRRQLKSFCSSDDARVHEPGTSAHTGIAAGAGWCLEPNARNTATVQQRACTHLDSGKLLLGEGAVAVGQELQENTRRPLPQARRQHLFNLRQSSAERHQLTLPNLIRCHTEQRTDIPKYLVILQVHSIARSSSCSSQCGSRFS